MAPLEPAIAPHALYTLKACKRRDILLWKLKVELADLKVRKMELVHAIAELEQEAAAAEIARGSDGPQSEVSKALSHGRGTSGITIFVDIDESEESRTLSHGLGTSGDRACLEGSEETRTLSHGRDMSKASDTRKTTVDETTTNAMNIKQRGPGSRFRNDEDNRLKCPYDTDSDSVSPTDEDSLSQRDANDARIRTEFKAREIAKSIQV